MNDYARRRMRDRMMRREMRDGRNPWGSRGGYVVSSRRRRDRAGSDMNRGYADMRYDYAMDYEDAVGYREDPTLYRNIEREEQKFEKTGAMERDEAYDMRRDYGDMRRMDGHRPINEGRTYFPIEAMGTFTGYYGMEEDYARGGRGGRGYRGGRDYGYDYNYDYARNDYARGDYRRGDYAGSDYAGDYGEKLVKEELEEWKKKLMKEVEQKDHAFFAKENIAQKAKQMGIKFEEFTEDELAVAALMMYTDYCMTIKPMLGSNMDIYIKLAKDFLTDPDAAVKGGEKLALYHDCIVEGE